MAGSASRGTARAEVPASLDLPLGADPDRPAARGRRFRAPRSLGGARACPPEDCGAPHGYGRLLAVLTEPASPSVRSCWEWLGGEFDPDAFDAAATDELLERYDRRTPQRSRR